HNSRPLAHSVHLGRRRVLPYLLFPKVSNKSAAAIAGLSGMPSCRYGRLQCRIVGHGCAGRRWVEAGIRGRVGRHGGDQLIDPAADELRCVIAGYDLAELRAGIAAEPAVEGRLLLSSDDLDE